VTKGQVEVLLHNPSGRNVLVTTMQAGQYFGEIELLRGSANIANIRAATESDVEVAMLDRDEFTQLLGESETTRMVIDQLASARAAENAAARGQEVARA
jgi:CRP-like cAMP-binding protein